jgi:predicted HTH domain antitoxin
MSTLAIEIPQDILDSARLTVAELKIELAVYLYGQERLSIGKARELAGMSLWEFRQLLGLRGIPPHYDEAELDKDVATIKYQPKELSEERIADTASVEWRLDEQGGWEGGSGQATTVTEKQILRELQMLERGRWLEVLDFIGYLKHSATLVKRPQAHSRELTARDLLESGLVGLWADRQDIGDSLEFARQLRQRAEHRWETPDAAR